MKLNMTKGNPTKLLIMFSIPILIGNIFQQFYNLVDSVIIGQFEGKNQFAALGSAGPLMSLVIFIIFGLCIGTSVLMSQFYGSGDEENLKKEISTSLIAGLIFTIVVSLLCFFLTDWMLEVTATPIETFEYASTYLKIVFLGMIFTFIYNFYASTLRAMGDSKTPLYFLIFSAVLNTVLDLLFVVIFKMGVAGVAIATVIAQGVSSILCIGYSYYKVPILRLGIRDLKFDKKLLKLTISFSSISALQQACVYLGKILVQSNVNELGVDNVAAYNAATKIDMIVVSVNTDFASAVSTFTALNKGAKRYDRIKQGFYKALKISFTFSLLSTAVLLIFPQQLVSLFLSGGENVVVILGGRFLVTMAPFYVSCALINVTQGYFRGLGKLWITLVSSLASIILRVIFSFILSKTMGLDGVAWGVIIGWLVSSAFGYFMFLLIQKKISKVNQEYHLS